MTTNSIPATEAAGLQDDPVRLFDMAAKKHKRELLDLWEDRGAPTLYLEDVSSTSLARILTPRVNYPDESVGELFYPERTGILFYSHAEDQLQVWLLDEHGVQAYDRQTIARQQLSAAIADVRNSLGVDSLQRSHLPRLRRDVSIVAMARRAAWTRYPAGFSCCQPIVLNEDRGLQKTSGRSIFLQSLLR